MLEDWVEEVSRALGIDADIDVDQLLDVARVVAHKVERRAAPVTTYLMGVAIASSRGDTQGADEVAAKVIALARSWNGPPEGT
ncbi:hypothetical protein BH24ACT26_BH24ACT26_01900 [soil metagenome]